MALYSIESEKFLGMTHSGAVTVEGESAVELSDAEVEILVNLIREKDTTDVEELELESSHPDLYETLRQAYYDMAFDAEEENWLREGFYNGCFEYNSEELMAYCKENCGFTFEYDKDDYLIDDDEIDESALLYDELDYFSEWLPEYVGSLDGEKVKKFFYNHMNVELDIDIDYTVEIPLAIIKMARNSA